MEGDPAYIQRIVEKGISRVATREDLEDYLLFLELQGL